MRVEFVELENFRLFRSLSLALGPGLNLFYGGNAEGKTSLLEALNLLASLRSFRPVGDRDLIHWEASRARVRVWLRRDRGDRRDLEIGWQHRPGRGVIREVRAGGRAVRRAAEFLGELPLAVFVPGDLTLVQGGPGGRRRYLDRLLCKLYPAYFAALRRYGRILEQRNKLLREGVSSSAHLQPWDEQLAHWGAVLIRKRQEVCRDLRVHVEELYARLSGEKWVLALRYRPSGSQSVEDFLVGLRRRRPEELRRRYTLVGPHRDDFELLLGDRELRRYGSQGQQRTAALALRLSEAGVLQERSGEGTVVLLDDCTSELDARRRERLLALLTGHPQVLVTGAVRPERLPQGSSCYLVEGGEIFCRGKESTP